MRVETLLSPGLLSNGFTLRRESAKAISSIEITARATPGGKTRGAATLAAFFTDCASKLSAIADLVAPLFSAAVAARVTATKFNVQFGETMDTTVVPATSTITIPSRTVTALAWTNSVTLEITVAASATVGDVITYTAPATNGIRDAAGNLVATGSKTST